MRSRSRWRTAAVALAVSLGTVGIAAKADYTVSNIGLGGGWAWIGDHRYGINASGQVAGSAYLPSGYQRAFRHSGGTTQDLGTLGGDWSWGYRINAAGHVIGQSYGPGNAGYHAFVWTAESGMIDLSLGGDYSWPAAINAASQVVGSSYTSGNGQHRAFSWTPSGGILDLGTLGGFHSYAYDVNESGQVVGQAQAASGEYRAFLWTAAGGMVDLGTLGGSYAWAAAINSSGQVVGGAYTASGHQHAFSWTAAGGMVDIGTLTGGNSSYAWAVSDSGHVLGYGEFLHSDGHIHCCRAFVWSEAGGLVPLTLGGLWSGVNSISPAGHVTGYAYLPTGEPHAFSWTPSGGLVDLGALGGNYSYAYAVNASGDIVGGAQTGTGWWRGFVHSGGTMRDLNDHLSSAPAGTEIYDAIGISDNGSIVAYSNAGLVLLSGGVVGPSAPAVGPISVSSDPVAVNTAVSASASFTDANAGDTHTASWTWGDGAPAEAGTVSESEGAGTTGAAHSYAGAGIYAIRVAVTDSSGLATQVSREIVVYDPSAGFVTGGGWIQSPAGAYKENPGLTGRATFGFVSKYQRGATRPSGNTEFHFQAASLRFHSDNYDWLVVAGARAQYKGTGTINGEGSYKFLLTAIDGDVQGGGGKDRFRIKIWYYDAEEEADVVVYDNQIDAGAEGTLTEGTVIGGGSIVIHAGKK
jgi:probable HAF family extracellular repeat protein